MTKEKEIEKYSAERFYLSEFRFFNGENYVTFNILNINTDKMVINVAVTNLGKISVIEYDLKRDKLENLYFEYGCLLDKIYIDDFAHIKN